MAYIRKESEAIQYIDKKLGSSPSEHAPSTEIRHRLHTLALDQTSTKCVWWTTWEVWH